VGVPTVRAVVGVPTVRAVVGDPIDQERLAGARDPGDNGSVALVMRCLFVRLASQAAVR
jgi:hypothetical protein